MKSTVKQVNGSVFSLTVFSIHCIQKRDVFPNQGGYSMVVLAVERSEERCGAYTELETGSSVWELANHRQPRLEQLCPAPEQNTTGIETHPRVSLLHVEVSRISSTFRQFNTISLLCIDNSSIFCIHLTAHSKD